MSLRGDSHAAACRAILGRFKPPAWSAAMSDQPIEIRPAVAADVPLLVRLIRGLAEYERMLDECETSEAALHEHLFGPQPYAEALIAEVGGEPAGFALFFPTYSTFRARPGIWLEDIFVLPERRKQGLGKALFAELARLAAARGCAR